MPPADFEFPHMSVDGDTRTECSDFDSESSEGDNNCRRYMLDTEDHDQPDPGRRCDSLQDSSCGYIVLAHSSGASDYSSYSSSSIGSEDSGRSPEKPLL